MTYKTHLTHEQRYFIHRHITKGANLNEIAESLGVRMYVLEAELIRGNTDETAIYTPRAYCPDKGQMNYEKEGVVPHE